MLHGRFGRHLIFRFALAGGTSPLAGDLAASLNALGHVVEVFSRSPNHKSVREYKDLDKISCDVLVNLIGGHASTMEESELQAILSKSNFLVNTAVSRQIPLIHVSSGSVLGTLDHPASSEQPRISDKFTTKYQEVKVRIEELHESNRHRVPIADLRLFSFAGPRFLKESGYFLSKLCRAAKEQTAFRPAGRGFLRDFTGPDELASALALAARSEFSGTANLFSDEPASRSQILKLFEENFGLVVQSEEEIYQEDIYCASKNSGLRGFTPRSSLKVISNEYVRTFGPNLTSTD